MFVHAMDKTDKQCKKQIKSIAFPRTVDSDTHFSKGIVLIVLTALNNHFCIISFSLFF